MSNENLTLEQELTLRIRHHQRAITGGYLAHQYIQKERHSAVQLPPFQMVAQADEYSDQVMANAIENGTFDMLYESVWNRIKECMPEYLNLAQP